MSARITTAELLQAVGQTYQSIDIRSAAIRDNHEWMNVLTVVRLSRKPPEAVRQAQEELQQSHGIVTTKNFRIVLTAVPYSEWRTLEEGCAKRQFRVADIDISLLEPMRLEQQQSDVRRYQYDLRGNDGWPWPSFDVWIGRHRPEKLSGEILIRELGTKGWSSPYEAINSLCEINVRQGGSYSYDFCLSLPVYAFIQEAKLSTVTDELQFTYVHHLGLADIGVVGIWKEIQSNQNTIVKKRVPAIFTNPTTDDDIRTETGVVVLGKLPDSDQVEIKVFHNKLGEIDSLNNTIRHIIPIPERNILFAAVRRFCNQSQLENALVRPYAQKAKKLKESAAFELHVSWLLSVYGFSPVVLGEYEQIADETTKVNRASVDILAGIPRKNSLLVVACTIGTPKEEDFLNLHHACEILSREVFSDTSVAVCPILFTGALNMPDYKEIGDGFSIIPIVDSDRMTILMQHLKANLEVLFLQFISNPRLCRLRSLNDEY